MTTRARAEQSDAAPFRDGNGPCRLGALIGQPGHRGERKKVANDDDSGWGRPIDTEVSGQHVPSSRHRVEEKRSQRSIVLVLPTHLDAALRIAVHSERRRHALASASDIRELFPVICPLQLRAARIAIAPSQSSS